MPKPHNGHRSWNAWNVALWIGNDEGLYGLAMQCNAAHKSRDAAATMFLRASGLEGLKTPDGATYNRLSVKLALEGLRDE